MKYFSGPYFIFTKPCFSSPSHTLCVASHEQAIMQIYLSHLNSFSYTDTSYLVHLYFYWPAICTYMLQCKISASLLHFPNNIIKPDHLLVSRS